MNSGERAERESYRRMLVLGSIMGFLAVAIGAFGAHALRERLVAPSLEIWQKASFYHFVHLPMLFLIPLFLGNQMVHVKMARRAWMAFLIGILLFSGSLYFYALTVERIFALITPLGGISLLLGWLLLGIAFYRSPTN